MGKSGSLLAGQFCQIMRPVPSVCGIPEPVVPEPLLCVEQVSVGPMVLNGAQACAFLLLGMALHPTGSFALLPTGQACLPLQFRSLWGAQVGFIPFGFPNSY